LGGQWLGLLGLALGAVDLVRRIGVRSLMFGGLVCWVLVPETWLSGNAERWQQVTPRLVTDNQWPNSLGSAGLLLLTVGVVRQEHARRSGRLPADA
jgi:hypothetical protein